MRFNDKATYTGEVTIWAEYDDRKELVYTDHNVVVSGMGETLAELMSTEDEGVDFFISRFQVGVSGTSALDVSSTNELAGKLTQEEYGIEENVNFIKATQKIGEREETNAHFITVNKSNTTLSADDKVKFSLIVGKSIANGQELNEVGLFSKVFSTPEEEICNLIAYHFFPVITKDSDYSLIFEWELTL